MKKIIFILSCVFVITILAGFVSAQAWPTNLNDGLVYYFKLDETSGNTIEHVANRVSGVVEGATQGVPGLINHSYSFDGVNDRVNFGDVTEVEGIDELTVSAWVKTFSNQNSKVIISNGFDSFYWLTTSNGGLIVSVWTVGSGCSVQTSGLSSGDWHLVSLVYNNGLLKVYIDGIPQGSTSGCGGTIRSTSENLVLGAWGSQNNFQGSIDEVGFWTRALDNSEILQLYNNGIGITYPIQPVCTDNDSDGYYLDCSPFDCNDNNPAINPDLMPCREFECTDRIDNDLDGFTDKSDQDCSQLQCQLPTFSTAGEG